MSQYDVIVIGGGPAGYPAAIRAGQNKLKVACIDEWVNKDGSYAFGGTCLNAGCIPSKAMLESSELVHRAQHEFATHGIKVGEVKVDLATMQKRRAGIVKASTQGISALFKAAGVTGLQGHGKLLRVDNAGNKVEYTNKDGTKEELTAKHVILASGSAPTELKSLPFDGKQIVDSWGALEFDAVPKRLGVIGAGIIGLELGSVWRRLGAEVVVLEALDTFLPAADGAVSKEALKHFKKLGLDIRLGAKVSGADKSANGVKLKYTDAKGEQSVEVDKVVVAIGRRPFTKDLLGEGTGVQIDERGFIKVDHDCKTDVPNVWAVGDVVRGPMLAHKGKEEGVMVADLIAGKIAEVNYRTIPSVIYTHPEIAWVGLTEEEVKKSGRAYKVGSFPFLASGRARAMENTAGFVKIVAAQDDDEILGVHIIGPMAGELIAEAVLAMEYSASTEDLQRTIHAHPTLSEAVHEAALNADKIAIDFPNR
ncbi:dihydrolipoyl dehydrogenase [Steroidobacter sp. S1-65]|uniref:Dihydrolipoyl dehydrogenase n=1 Tax=Steroidobacter gossypii TaxID=2805490 RepID=A0ABS1WWQ1_9GAMM|nr:dihydrolipoyl dehydrogenase [Steroidobacter gossypii]MBM0105404.1 dihydrolipoyl dehydrogenase [Steroidobacter gossypii]